MYPLALYVRNFILISIAYDREKRTKKKKNRKRRNEKRNKIAGWSGGSRRVKNDEGKEINDIRNIFFELIKFRGQ